MSSPSSNRYQSRLFNFIATQSLRLADRLSRTARQIKVASIWGAQLLLYPVYALFQTARLAGKQIQQAVNHRIHQLQPPKDSSDPLDLNTTHETLVADRAIQQVWNYLHILQLAEKLKGESFNIAFNFALTPPSTSATLPAVTTDPEQEIEDKKLVRGIAMLLENRALVLVSADNEILDILTTEQQQQLHKRILWEVANFARQLRLISVDPEQIKRELAPPIDRETLLPPVRGFRKLMAWVQRGSLAVKFNLFQEAAWVTPEPGLEETEAASTSSWPLFTESEWSSSFLTELDRSVAEWESGQLSLREELTKAVMESRRSLLQHWQNWLQWWGENDVNLPTEKTISSTPQLPGRSTPPMIQSNQSRIRATLARWYKEVSWLIPGMEIEIDELAEETQHKKPQVEQTPPRQDETPFETLPSAPQLPASSIPPRIQDNQSRIRATLARWYREASWLIPGMAIDEFAEETHHKKPQIEQTPTEGELPESLLAVNPQPSTSSQKQSDPSNLESVLTNHKAIPPQNSPKPWWLTVQQIFAATLAKRETKAPLVLVPRQIPDKIRQNPSPKPSTDDGQNPGPTTFPAPNPVELASNSVAGSPSAKGVNPLVEVWQEPEIMQPVMLSNPGQNRDSAVIQDGLEPETLTASPEISPLVAAEEIQILATTAAELPSTDAELPSTEHENSTLSQTENPVKTRLELDKKADSVEAKALFVGYVKHPLEQVLEWLDQIMLRLENKIIGFFQWLSQLWHR